MGYPVVAKGDDGDEAEGKHRQLFLRFDGDIVAALVLGTAREAEAGKGYHRGQ